MRPDLPEWLSDPDLDGLWQRVTDRLERSGLAPVGRVRVALAGRDERHAASALLGRSVTRDSVVVDLAVLDSRLRERSGHGGLVDVLTVRNGRPLRDRVAERHSRTARREEPLELARQLVDRPWAETWVAGLRRTGLLTRSAAAGAVVREAAAILDEVLDRTAPDARSRVELAAQVVGDAHALDEDRLLHRVVLRALAAAAGVEHPDTVGERWALWESVGVSPDGVSSTCLTLGLRTDGSLPLAARLALAADAGDPVHLTRWDLSRMPGFSTPDRPVLVCENPRVLEAVAQTYAGRVPVVCTAGEPSTLVAAVLTALNAGGATLRYHGDFDWPGIAITNRMVTRFGVTPWLMRAADYDAHVHPDAPELTGPPVDPSWDAELGPAMRSRARSLHEETVLPTLLPLLTS